jgi:hypothetical protein
MNLWDHFVEITQEVFAPLVDDFSFQRLPLIRPFIYYESATLQVDFFYDVERSYELDVSIRRRPDVHTRKPSYGLSSLLAIHDAGAWETYRSSCPRNHEALGVSLREMRELLFSYGAALLAGDNTDLERCDYLESQIAAEFAKPGDGRDYVSRVQEVVLRYHDGA